MKGKSEPRDVPPPHARELTRVVKDQIYEATGVSVSLRARPNQVQGKKLVCTGPLDQLHTAEILAIEYIQGTERGHPLESSFKKDMHLDLWNSKAQTGPLPSGF